jgi:hypothetical protein
MFVTLGIPNRFNQTGKRSRKGELREKMLKTWRATFRQVPFDNWRARAEKLAALNDDLAALDTFQALRNDMAYLEEAIHDAAGQLDSWIQLEIDRARGK